VDAPAARPPGAASDGTVTVAFDALGAEAGAEAVREGVRIAAADGIAVRVFGPAATLGELESGRVEVVDTTGAGDLYAAGVLYGLTHGKDLATAGRMGSIAAAEAISHMGARPEAPLKDLVKKKLG